MRRVPVRGGELAVELTEGSSAPVLAVHGVSSNCRLWNWLSAEAPDLQLLRPDLRGRAGSFDVEGPSSLAQHVEDLVAVLDAFGLDRVTVCGMSMGGFVAVELAVSHPERVRGLVLVDGGPPMAVSGQGEPDDVRRAFTPQASRHEQVFADVDAYCAFFLSGPTLLDPRDPLLTDYLRHDLGDDGRPRLAREVVLDDAVDTLLGANRWDDLEVPVRFLAAEWAAGRDTPPAYPEDLFAAYALAEPVVHAERVPGVDHAGIIMTADGAAAVAEQVRAAVVGGAGQRRRP